MTFTLRSRLTLLYTVLFGVLLAVIAAVSYHVLAYQLDADVSANLTELTTGLHGYLRFPNDRPTVIFDQTDPAQAAFVEEATRYYQVFNARTGELIVQSDALRPLGLEFTPAEVRQFGDRPVNLDLDTDYGRIRLSNSVLTPAASQIFLLQVGVSLAPMDAVLKRFFILLVMSVPAGLIVTFVIGRWMAGVALRPLMRLADVARSIDIGDLRPRLPIRGARDELDVVANDDPLHQAEPEAHTFDLRRPGGIHAEESFEDLRHQLRGDADAGVFHGEPRAPLAAQNAHRDSAAGWRELDRVVDQVEHQPLQPVRIGVDDNPWVNRIGPQADALGLRHRLELIDEPARELAEVDGLRRQLDLASLRPREGEDLIDQSFQLVDLFELACEAPAVLLGTA